MQIQQFAFTQFYTTFDNYEMLLKGFISPGDLKCSLRNTIPISCKYVIAMLIPIQNPLISKRGPTAKINEDCIGSPTVTLTLCTSTGHNLLCLQNCQMPILTTFLSYLKGIYRSFLPVNKMKESFNQLICLKIFSRKYKQKLFKPLCCIIAWLFTKMKYLPHWFLTDTNHPGSGIESCHKRKWEHTQYFSLKSTPCVTDHY